MDAISRIHLLPDSAYNIPFSLFLEDVFVIIALPDRRTLPKQAFPPPRHNGDKIRPWLGVVVPFQPDRTAVMFLRSGCGHLNDRMIQSALCSISAAICNFAWLS